MNCPSVEYDILSGAKPVLRESSIDNLRATDEKIGFKKKAIAELSDLGRLYHPNFNLTYKDYFIGDKDCFKKAEGMCSKLADGGYKNGQVHKLFYNYRDAHPLPRPSRVDPVPFRYPAANCDY